MKFLKEPILVIIQFEDEIYKIPTYKQEYRSLMHLISDNLVISEFGECKGVVRCGTCLIEFINIPNKASLIIRNEAATLRKLERDSSNYRLSCQILIDDEINNLECKIVTSEATNYK